jgi:hypothetical protein
VLRQTRAGDFEAVRRGPRRPSRAQVERARDGVLLVLTERGGLSVRVAAEILGMPASTARDRLRAIPPDARERFLDGPTHLALVGLGAP